MSVNLKIAGDGMSVDKTITLTQAGKIIAFLGTEVEMSPLVSTNGRMLDTLVDLEAKPIEVVRQSAREIIDQANPNTHSQRITVFGQYLGQTHPEGFFTSEEVKEQYQLAREKLTPHFSRDIGKAITDGWIEQVRGEKNTFYITRKGEEAIKSGFATSSRTKSRPRAKQSSSKVATISESEVSEAVIGVQPVVPTLNGLPNYHQLKSKGLKIMWILAMAQSKSIEKLSTKELAYFAGKLRDKLAIGDVNGHTQTAAKNGWVTKDNESNYILLHDGEEHLKSLVSTDEAD